MLPTIAMLLRSYAKTENLVEEVVERAVVSVKKANNLTIFGQQVIAKIIIAIAEDYDCGKTKQALEKRLSEEHLLAEVHSFKGHHSHEVLNLGVEMLVEEGLDYCLIISNKAVNYLNQKTMLKVLVALFAGFKAVAVKIRELSESEALPTENTFMLYDLSEVRYCPNELIAQQLLFKSKIAVEEIDPVVDLIKTYGKKAVAVVEGEGSLNIRESVDGQARHKEVKDTKRARQEQECERLGVTIAFVKNNIVEL